MRQGITKQMRVLAGTVALAVGIAASVLAAPTAAAASGPTKFIKVYANIINKVQYNLTPEDVQATSDGGYIVLGLTPPPSSGGAGVSWLLKLNSSGTPQWQKEVGCFSLPPGSYSDGVSVQQTSDGGFVIGGGTIGCGSASICPSLSGIACALVEKLDSAGRLAWARAYGAGFSASTITQLKQTNDGGFIAVGSSTNSSQNTGALILKLDGQGSVQWQRELGPGASSTQAYLNAVQQTTDGGYVATGEFFIPQGGTPHTSVLVVKLDAKGNLSWQHGFNDLNSQGSPIGSEQALSIVQTPDGGFAVAGTWSNSNQPGQCCAGALLLKLDSSGSIQWQKAYSGGVYCYFNGYSETCLDIGAVVYSVHRTSDGGYLLAGDGDLILQPSGHPDGIAPWMAKVDGNGNLLWQHFYYQTYKPTGNSLSEYFASSTLSSDGGAMAVGWTENYSNGKGQLYGVKTDSAGLVGACSEVHPATPLNAINPGLAATPPSLPVQTVISPSAGSPAGTLTTSVNTVADC